MRIRTSVFLQYPQAKYSIEIIFAKSSLFCAYILGIDNQTRNLKTPTLNTKKEGKAIKLFLPVDVDL